MQKRHQRKATDLLAFVMSVLSPRRAFSHLSGARDARCPHPVWSLVSRQIHIDGMTVCSFCSRIDGRQPWNFDGLPDDKQRSVFFLSKKMKLDNGQGRTHTRD
jgi:hypothetical protein